MIYIILLLFTSLCFAEDFMLEDLNETSIFYGELVGPSSFTNEVSLVYFGHYNWGTCTTRFGQLNDLYNELLIDGYTEVKLFGDINIGSKIKKNLNIYKNVENKSIFYSLKINSDQKKNVVSKDAKGDPKIFEIQVLIDLTILENNKVKNKKNFKESFTYNNSTNKFSLKQYEKNIEENLIEKIVEKIIIYLYSI